MTDFTHKQGETRTRLATAVDEDGNPIDLTGAIVEKMLKFVADDPDSAAVVAWLSYFAAQIDLAVGGTNQYRWFVIPSDSAEIEACVYCWETVVWRQGASKTTAGTVAVVAGSAVITGTGLVLTDVEPNDVIVPVGGTAPNQQPIRIVDVGGSGKPTDPGAGNLLTNFTGWDTEAGMSHEIFQGVREAPAGGSGAYTVQNSLID